MSNIKNKKSYFYSAYGFNIRSDIPLPELIPSDSGEDIRIRFDEANGLRLYKELKNAVTFNRPGCTVRVSSRATYYDWNGIATALIRNGDEVIINTKEGIENTDLSPFITGAIFGNLLNQRGLSVLHGSAVLINGEGAAFLGDKGAGKSTLAAYLQRSGYALLTDDLLPVSFDDGNIYTTPGFPRIRLWDDSVESFGMNPDDLPQINRFIDKRSYRCFENFSGQSVKINRIYILAEHSEIEVERLNFHEAFIELTRHSYLSRYFEATGQTAEHFHRCKTIISTVPVYRLKRPHNFEVLSEVSSRIENHS